MGLRDIAITFLNDTSKIDAKVLNANHVLPNKWTSPWSITRLKPRLCVIFDLRQGSSNVFSKFKTCAIRRWLEKVLAETLSKTNRNCLQLVPYELLIIWLDRTNFISFSQKPSVSGIERLYIFADSSSEVSGNDFRNLWEVSSWSESVELLAWRTERSTPG